MKPAPFDYHRPDSVAAATQMLSEFGDDAKLLGGGQSLVPMLSMRLAFFDHLIDISRLDEMKGVRAEGDSLWIGGGTTHAVVGSDERVRTRVPLLTRATPLIGHFQIRSRGTIGGSIAHADPAAEYGAVALALDATVEVVSASGRREIPAGEFFAGVWETAMEADEVLVGLRFPVWSGRCGFAVEEFARRHGDFAIAGAVAAVELDHDDKVRRSAIGLLGLSATPRRASAAEAAITGRPVGDITAEEIGELAMSGLDDIPADLQGSANYRRKVGASMAAQAWRAAVKEAFDA
ncbi:FAD binding domain-containing protein [Mycolicibacterium aichiense]|uniref:Carbon monoxide dehydrogenase n=1 Tax=Mycolicibacterium aichiense TaxID=1799 RepID=A0AAD1HKI1_9MYCO|nr:xanthine dehydrogenase family protein subunit M [Mycolicibacterium aichiense]MCV7021234.1 xanthine dehydrogenase family protein subunit M [Mycolicibacterium aichiense]BBX05813.1 carbon monoxide dehydrogenase [Mycolicibacterium aichiense]STZ24845.1 aerobic-type carbon monoxide dehydrogenase, CoxM_3 [Mycolicibacterium aichiense]